ncbi:MAG TPA: GNVR domain-containing protein [Terriglobales bacterium]|nr:GNVR domain-containing protein [Terriglobales bacterium]
MSGHGNNGHSGYVDTDMFDVAGFVRLVSRSVRHHRAIVLITCAATLVLVTMYVLIWPPIYRVEAKLAAERDMDPARDQFYSNWQVFRKDDARDEIQLFTAGPVLRKVIDENKLTYDDVYHPFMDHVSYLWEKSWPGRAYMAVKRTISPDPDAPNAQTKQLGRIMDGMKAAITVEPVADTHIATLEVKGPNRHVAEITNSLINAYLEYRSQRHATEAEKAVAVLNREADRAREELAVVRDRRSAFARANGLMMDFQKESLDIKELTGVETGISNEKAKIASLEASLKEVETEQKAENPLKVLSSTQELNSVRENAMQRKLELQTSLIGLRDKYREDSPEVQEVVADIAKLDVLIASEPEKIDRSVTHGVNTIHDQLLANRDQLQAELEGTRAALTSMQDKADSMRGHLTKLPELMSTAQDLNREYDIAAEKYKQLLLRKMEAEVSSAAVEAAPGTVTVVDYAIPPSSKYWPRLKYLYPGAVLVGLLLGTIAAVLRTLTAGRLMKEHIDRGRIAYPVYATIPLGGRARALTVFPHQSEHARFSANAPRERSENNRSERAGA